MFSTDGMESLKKGKEVNKSLFHTYGASRTYPKRIALLLKLNECNSIELSSSEWKKSSVSESLILRQQTSNLKVNVCILLSLYSTYGNKFDTVLAMDWIGNIGYLYKITRVDQVFITDQVNLLMIPENVKAFGMLKNTFDNLLKLKYFMKSMSEILRQDLFKISSQDELSNIVSNIRKFL